MIERVTLGVEREISVPLLLLVPVRSDEKRVPVVVCVAQEGKHRFLRERAGLIAELIKDGIAVCLPDVRGTGETVPKDGSRGRNSAATAHSSTALMLGSTLLGERLGDLCGVLDWLSDHKAIDRDRIALWGDSFAPVNSPDRNPAVPLDAEPFPDLAEPLGGVNAGHRVLGAEALLQHVARLLVDRARA